MRIVLILWLALMPTFSFAQDIAFEGILSDSLVITANRIATQNRETGRRVTVLTASQIQMLPVSSYGELLRAAAGVEIFSRGGFGIQGDITMRGSTFNGVMILLDGVPLNDPQTGHFNTDFPVPMSEIARIEVLHGPAASLYGPDALGGVIQLFTWAGLDVMQQNQNGGSVQTQYGANNSILVDAAGRMKRSNNGTNFTMSAATTYQATEGENILDADGNTIDFPTGGLVKTDFSRQAHSVAVGFNNQKIAVFTRLGFDKRDFGAFHYYTTSSFDFAREETSTKWLQAQIQNLNGEKTNWKAHIVAKLHSDFFEFNPTFDSISEHDNRLFRGQIQVDHVLTSSLRMIVGASANYRDIISTNYGNYEDAAGGLFASFQYQTQNGLTLNLGSRVDYDPAYGLEPTPNVSFAWNQSSFTVRGNVARAVRAPNYVERYSNRASGTITAGRNYGNPDLKSERSWSYEAGLDWYSSRNLSFHLTGFQRKTDNLIDFAMTGGSTFLSDSVFLAQNILAVTTTGIEFESKMRKDFSAGHLNLDLAYTFLDADLGDVADGTVFKYAVGNAKHLVQSHLTYNLSGFSAGVNFLWKERLQEGLDDQKSYAITNLRTAWMMPIQQNKLVFSVEIRNVMDVKYTEVLDAPLPGRWWLAGIKFVR